MRRFALAVLVLFLLGAGLRVVSAGNPDPGAGMESTPTPDLVAGSASTPAPDVGASVDSTPVPDPGTGTGTTSAPAPGVVAAATPVPDSGGQCFGSGTNYVPGFGCMAGSLRPVPTASNPPLGGCPGNASSTVYGCTAGYAPITGSTNSNANGGNGCPGNSHRTAFGCTPGPP